MPDVENSVAVRRARHCNAVFKPVDDLCNCFAALTVFVFEGGELVNADRVELLEYVDVLHKPFDGIVISQHNVCTAVECFGTVTRIRNFVCQLRLELLNIVTPRCLQD